MKRFLLFLSAWLLLLPSCVEREREEMAVPLAEGDFTLSLMAELPEMPVVESEEEVPGTLRCIPCGSSGRPATSCRSSI